jgi:hypothetical protein
MQLNFNRFGQFKIVGINNNNASTFCIYEFEFQLTNKTEQDRKTINN